MPGAFEADLLLDLRPPVPVPTLPAGVELVADAAGEAAALVARAFPGRWADEVARYAAAGTAVLALRRERRTLGFCVAARPEDALPSGGLAWTAGLPGRVVGLGPLGLEEAARGGGLGLALVAEAARWQRAHGRRRRGDRLDRPDPLLRAPRRLRLARLPARGGARVTHASDDPRPERPGIPATERVDPAFADLDAWPLERSLAALADGQARAIAAVQRALPQLEVAAAGVEARLAAGGRLVYAGAGTSGRLAVLDAAELPPTFGFERTVVLMAGGAEAGASAREGAEDDEDDAVARVAAASVGPADAFVGIAASGRTPFTVAALRAARAAGAFTIGIANVAGTPLLEAAQAPVWLDTGPEVLAGSTRLAAGTAQKAALNLISTAVLVRLGGAYGNQMVGMRALNTKLRRRAAAMVARAAEVDEARAVAAVEAAGGDLRVAIVVARTGVDVERARAALDAHGQRVRAALGALGEGSG